MSHTLTENLDHLRHIEHYQEMVAHLRGDYEQALNELCEAGPEDRDKLTGAIKTYREVLDIMEPCQQ